MYGLRSGISKTTQLSRKRRRFSEDSVSVGHGQAMKSGNARSLTGDILVTEEVASVLVKTDNGWDLAFADSNSYIIRCKRHVDPYFIKAFMDSDMGKDALKSYIQIGRIDKTPIPIMYEENVKLISKCMHDIIHEKLTAGSRYDSELRSIQNVFGKKE